MTPNETMLVTEVMEGGSLHALLRSRSITWWRGCVPALWGAGVMQRPWTAGTPNAPAGVSRTDVQAGACVHNRKRFQMLRCRGWAWPTIAD